MSDDEIVPFGKYKDQPIEVMLADHGYTEWLRAQPWLPDRYTKVYNVIVGAGGEPQDTPEHNALQARFLNHNEALRFVSFRDFEEALADWRSIASKCTPEQQANLIPPTSYSTKVYRLTFEAAGWDVLIGACSWFRVDERGKDYPQGWLEEQVPHTYGGGFVNPTTYSAVRESRSFEVGAAVELKPTVGEDYPSILRSVLKRMDRPAYGFTYPSNCRAVVFAEQVTFRSVTLAQVKEIFSSRGVDFLTMADLPAPVPCACDRTQCQSGESP